MKIANRVQVQDAWSERPLRAGEAFLVRILNIIQKYYAESNDAFKWTTDDSTGIWIGEFDAFAELDPGLKPAIVGKRGQVGYANVGGVGKRLAQNRKTGGTTYSDQVTSIITLNCIHSNRAVAENIGLDVFELFGYIRPELRYNGFQNFKGPTLMEVAKLSGSVRPGSWTAPIQMSGSMQITWEVTPDSPELKDLNVRSNIK